LAQEQGLDTDALIKIEMARSVRQKRAKRLLKHRLARSEGIPMGVDATNLGECLQAYYPVFSA